MGVFGGSESVTLRSGATLRCGEHELSIELRPVAGESQVLELSGADGNYGGSEANWGRLNDSSADADVSINDIELDVS